MSHVLMRLAARFPLGILHVLGALLGWAAYGSSPTYRRRLRENLEAAGYRDAATRRAAIAGAGRMLAELPAIWLRPRAEVLALLRSVEGREHLQAARASGKGIVFLTPHLGCFEIAARFAASEHPITVLYRPPKRAWLRSLVERSRTGAGNVHLARADLAGTRKLLGALGRREAVGILPDQVPGEGRGEWAEFFGRPAYTMTLAMALAARAGCACLIAWGERLSGGAGYVLHIRPLPAALPGEDPARRQNRAIEALIRERPGQYLWGYNRFKRPRGAPARPAEAA
jgi:KDO2-lipid IV(A) lauroyltransferase